MISGIVDSRITYPGSEEFFSPDERFPEYPFEHVASRPNSVYRAVRDVFAQAGLDAEHFGTSEWNPLGHWVGRGQSVFVLCNFVYHRRTNESAEQFESKCTHGSVIRAVVDYLYIAVGPTGHVSFGNAPVQSCSWSRVLEETGAARVEEFYATVGAPVKSADLRLFVAEGPANIVANPVERRDDTAAVTIDLAQRSLLSVLDEAGVKYRVSDYPPERTDAFHRNGSHQYVIHRAVLSSDVIFSIPKLKTHEKVGITCAVKGSVGAIGHKDCLAHHRVGTPDGGGDEFRSDPVGLLGKITAFHDAVQRTPPESLRGRSMRLALKILRYLVRRIAPTMNGAWSGNDTCWRMAVDIARLIQYARPDGTIAPEMQRRHLALVDGVVGGEGNGPLAPNPIRLGALLFADDPVSLDHAATRLMGFDPKVFPIVREAARVADLPLIPAVVGPIGNTPATINGEMMTINAAGKFAPRPFRLPNGWDAVQATAATDDC
jgi:uncharacterized protein (DUF362 family)